MAVIYRMQNEIQRYAWGSTDAIAQIIGMDNPARLPIAEYWMGAHPKASSQIDGRSLCDAIANEPHAMIGATVDARFGARLPFLLKIISAARALSIQAHPTLEQARTGFAREQEAGIDIMAPRRNYRDDNHKPEVMCALTPFWALCGFRPLGEIATEFGDPHFAGTELIGDAVRRLADAPNGDSLRQLLHTLMNCSGGPLRALLHHALAVARSRQIGRDRRSDEPLSNRQIDADAPHHYRHPRYYWVRELHRQFGEDVGVLAPLYLNCIRLEPGTGVFLGPGVLHAYLEGTGVELMANSDNVLRGGLTGKHVDVEELLAVLGYEGGEITPMQPDRIADCEVAFDTSAPEFRLSCIKLQDRPYRPNRGSQPEILFCLSGRATIGYNGNEMGLDGGQSIFVSAAAGSYTLNGQAEIYRATVPLR